MRGTLIFQNCTKKYVKIINILAFLVLIANSGVFGQSAGWRYFTTDNSGLPSNSIQSIMVDHKGVKWFGTDEGLVKFDGINWTVFNTENSDIPGNNVEKIVEDKTGNIWFITDLTSTEGVVKFDGDSWELFTADNGTLTDWTVLSIAIDSSNNVWVGHQVSGLAKYDGNSWTYYYYLTSEIPEGDIYDITVQSDGKIWFATSSSGTVSYDGSNWNIYNHDNSGLSDDSVSGIFIDKFGQKWFTVGYGANEICIYNDTTWTVLNNLNSALSPYRVGAIIQDDADDMWIVNYDQLLKYDFNGWEKYNRNNSGLIGTNYSSLYFEDGELWIGANEGIAVATLPITIVTSVNEAYPDKIELSRNYPNPFNPTTKIEYNLEVNSKVLLEVFDINGKKIKVLEDGIQNAGIHSIGFNGINLASGVYICRLQVFDEKGKTIYLQGNKMVLLK